MKKALLTLSLILPFTIIYAGDEETPLLRGVGIVVIMSK